MIHPKVYFVHKSSEISGVELYYSWHPYKLYYSYPYKISYFDMGFSPPKLESFELLA
jgi:hypothetical protein